MSAVSYQGSAKPLIIDRTIFDYADELAVEVPTSCRRNGECHECVVEIADGMASLSPRTEPEGFLRGTFRLACQARIVADDRDISFTPLRRRPRILEVSHARGRRMTLNPMVTRVGDEVWYGNTAIDVYRGAIFGLAVDLGTTTVVLELVDLETGDTVEVTSFENPQQFGGSDIMNRISYEARRGVSGELRNAVVTAINGGVREMVTRQDRRPPHLYEIVVAANSTMRDILFGLSVQTIGQKPYKSLVEHEYRAGRRPHTALLSNTRELGIRANRRALVYGLPLIASHVGADTAACLETVQLGKSGATEMLVDMGTNTEVVLHHRGRLYAASCPAGPAFEGGLVTYGMRAYDGAIESISLAADGSVDRYQTIGGAPADGICGSGLTDLLAELRRKGLMTPLGVFTKSRKLMSIDVIPERGITFSKRDIGNLAQAKAANYCGQLIVMRTAGVCPDEIDRLYLAGGFANYLNVPNAIEIGLVAPVPEDRIVKVGNAAIDGARSLLIDKSRRPQAEEEAKHVTHIELETTPDFFELFVDGCQMKPMPTRLPSTPEMEPAARMVAL